MKIAKDCRGSITVFLALIFAGILIVTGVITDAARIMVAEKRVQGSLESAVRSGMAGYHEDLAGEFGLYGQPIDEETIRRYFLTNLTERHGNIRLIKYGQAVLKVEAQCDSASLLNDERFREQVLQYMKYKAPLIISESAGQKLLECFASSGFKKESGFAASVQKAIDIRKVLKSELAELNDSLRDVAAAISEKIAAESINELERIKASLKNEVIRRIKEYGQALDMANDHRPETETGNLADPETEGLMQKTEGLIAGIDESIDLLRDIERLEMEISASQTERRISELIDKIDGLRAQLPTLEEIELVKPVLEQFTKNSTAKREAEAICAWLKKKLPVKVIEPSFLIPDIRTPNSGQPQLRKDGHYRMGEDLAENEGSEITSLLSQLAGAMSGILTDGRDRLYITEYVMDKYTFLMSATKRQHFFNKGEVEYILCGDNSELTNLLNMFGQIWFFRYAVNTLATFLQSTVPHPLARLAYSLAKGFLAAWQDVIKLYGGEGVPVIPHAADGLKIKYSDHLRIFLLLQDENIQLERMKQLIQINLKAKQNDKPDFELQRYQTSCQAVAEVDMNLWFIPALHLDVLGFERFCDGNYRIIKEAVFSY